MSLNQTTTHIQEAIANLVSQFKGKVTLEALVAAYVDQVQDIENALFEVLEATVLTATGATLDGYGEIVGEEREGETDDEIYRLRIRAKILINISSGTAENLFEIVLKLAGDTKTCQYVEDGTAEYELTVVEKIDIDGFLVASQMTSADPAGVRGIFRWHEIGDLFQFNTGGLGFDGLAGFAGAVD